MHIKVLLKSSYALKTLALKKKRCLESCGWLRTHTQQRDKRNEKEGQSQRRQYQRRWETPPTSFSRLWKPFLCWDDPRKKRNFYLHPLTAKESLSRSHGPRNTANSVKIIHLIDLILNFLILFHIDFFKKLK